MSYELVGNRLSQDACAIEQTDVENKKIIDYTTARYFDDNSNQYQINTKFGYGVVNPDMIDAESCIKLVRDIRGPVHQQLSTRLFHAIPDLSRGVCVPNIESQLQQGVGGHDKQCKGAKSIDTFVPLTSCMTNYIYGATLAIPDVHTIGRPSKDILKEMRQCSI
jgi:hypothetical protein